MRCSGNPLELHLGIAHSLGYILGQKLCLGLVSGRIEHSAVRDLLKMPFSSGNDAETA